MNASSVVEVLGAVLNAVPESVLHELYDDDAEVGEVLLRIQRKHSCVFVTYATAKPPPDPLPPSVRAALAALCRSIREEA